MGFKLFECLEQILAKEYTTFDLWRTQSGNCNEKHDAIQYYFQRFKTKRNNPRRSTRRKAIIKRFQVNKHKPYTPKNFLLFFYIKDSLWGMLATCWVFGDFFASINSTNLCRRFLRKISKFYQTCRSRISFSLARRYALC